MYKPSSYANHQAADANYPHGSAKNESSAGAKDGFPFEKGWVNDWFGFQQALAQTAGITPSGNSDTAVASQMLQALYGLRWSDNIEYAVGARVIGSDGEEYRNVVATGPTSGNAVDPVGDTSEVWTSTTKIYSHDLGTANGAAGNYTVEVQEMSLSRYGKTVYIHGSWRIANLSGQATGTTDASIWTALPSIPDGYRPIGGRHTCPVQMGFSTTDSAPCMLYISDTTAAIRALPGANADHYYLGAAWLTEDFIQ